MPNEKMFEVRLIRTTIHTIFVTRNAESEEEVLDKVRKSDSDGDYSDLWENADASGPSDLDVDYQINSIPEASP